MKPNVMNSVMKKTKNTVRTLLLVLLLGAAGMAKATTFVVDNIEYEINPDGTSVTVLRLSVGNGSGSLVIPSLVLNEDHYYHVTKIAALAFSGCSGFTGSLTIPSSVTQIDSHAFSGCSGFTGNLTIPNSVTVIGTNAFQGCSGFTGSLKLSNSITQIKEFTFHGCSGFKGRLKIPNSVTQIDNYAFYGCSGFTDSLVISNSLTWIGSAAFEGCSGFTGKLTIPNSVIEIGSAAFSGCSGFTGGLTVPDSVVLIRQNAFKGCTGIQELTIGTSVTTIGDWAFQNCSSLTTVNFNATNCTQMYSYQSSLGTYSSVFKDCANLTTLRIGENVQNIPDHAFHGCSSLTGDLVIPNTVTAIGQSAFVGCTGFTGNLVIGNSVTTIRNNAFNNCTGITGCLTIGEAVTEIQNYVFRNCTGISSISVLAATPPNLSYYAFYNANIQGKPVKVPCGSLSAYQSTSPWSGFTNLQEDCLLYEINPDGASVTVIGHADGTAASGPLVIPSTTVIDDVSYTVTAIGERAFRYSYDLAGALVIPNTVKTIGSDAFAYCVNFTTLVLGNSLETIEYGAFAYCAGFSGKLNIPASVTTIGDWAFGSCRGFTGNLVIPESVTLLGNSAFRNCLFTGTLRLPNSITNIGRFAFSDCTGFDNLVLGDSLAIIQYAAFNGCTGLSGTLTLPATLSLIEEWAFCNCTGFTEIHSFAEEAPAIAENTFSNMNGDIPIMVPCGAIENYQSSWGWSEFTNYFEFLCPVTQTIPLVSGWNWFSSYIGYDKNTLASIKAQIEALGGTAIIKSQNDFTQYGTNGWFGSLNSLDNSQTYMVLVDQGLVLEITGQPVDPEVHPLTLTPGWNWIAYQHDTELGVVEALNGLNPSDGDIIKSQDSFATYKASTGQWMGSLTTLIPGKGYMYLKN